MGIETLPVELHYRDCVCKGSGWISYPGIGAKAHKCESVNVVRIGLGAWKQMGKPKTADELRRS